jgi:WD40 repeat protein
VQFGSDDRTAAYIDHTGRVHCLEFAPADCFRRLPPNRPASNSGRNLDVSRDDRLVLAPHLEGFTLWDLSSGRELITVPNSICTSARFTPDGRSILTFCRDGVMRWPLTRTVLTNGEEIRIGSGQLIGEGVRRYGAISADGQWGCATYDSVTNQVEIFLLNNPAQRIPLGNHRGACSVAFSPDGRWLASGTWSGGSRGGVEVRDLDARKLEHKFSELYTANVEFSPDGRWLATGSHPVQLWEVGSWHEHWRFGHLDSNSPWIQVTFSPKSDLLAVVVRDRDIALLAVATGRVLANFESADRPSLVCLRFTPDGTKLVALQNDRGLQVWDLRRLRVELASMNLDWDAPPYPPEQPSANGSPLPISITIEKPEPDGQ